MELIIKNADFSACGIGIAISNEVRRMMAKYSNFADDDEALQAMQKFYTAVGSETLAKCTIIVPCFAANVVEAMKDLVTDTDLRSETFNSAYYSIIANKGLVATNEASKSTIPYRTIKAVNGASNKYTGQLRLFALSETENFKYISTANGGGFLYSQQIQVNEAGYNGLTGLVDSGLTLISTQSGYFIKGFDYSKGIVGILDNKSNGSKYSVLDYNNKYSTIRTTEGGDTPYNTMYFNQGYISSPNTTCPIAMYVWGIGITEAEAVTIRDAVYHFTTDLGINPAQI